MRVKGKRILVVDDEPNVLLTMSAILRQEGYDVEEANGGEFALEALGRWMMRFSPVVALDVGKTSVPCEALFLDLTGCERFFGGLENILQCVSNALAHFGISAHVAIAPTPGAAWALADSGKHLTIVPRERLESALAPLPVCPLRIEREISTALNHLGLCTIGQVMHLPREVLPARFGQVLLRRIDEAVGRIPEPLIPL